MKGANITYLTILAAFNDPAKDNFVTSPYLQSMYLERSALIQSGPASPLAQKNFNSIRGAMKLGHKCSRRALAKHGKAGLGALLHVRAERSSTTRGLGIGRTPPALHAATVENLVF